MLTSVRSASEINLTRRDNSTNHHGLFGHRPTDVTNWHQIGAAGADATTLTDGSAAGGTTYQFRVSAFTSSFEAFSEASAEVTTPTSPLTLDGLSGGKRKGAIYVDLSWSGASALGTVEIWRSVNGGPWSRLATTANDGSERDSSSLKGGYTLQYQIRSTDGAIISNTRSITF